VNPTYNWIISDGYSTFPTSSCFLSLATPFLKPSRSPDWPLPFSRRCVLGAYHGEPAINWKGGARLSQEWLHNYSIYIYIYMWVSIYIYMDMVQRSNPPPPRPGHGHGSAIVLSPSPPLWCGGGVVLSPSPWVWYVWYDSMYVLYGMYGYYDGYGMFAM